MYSDALIVVQLEIMTFYQWSDIQSKCLVILGPTASKYWEGEFMQHRADLVYRAMGKICNVTG